MKIVRLSAENFKRLVAVEIKPDGNTVLITGKNGAGKSSVLDAIMSALCGKKHTPDKPIREGQESAVVTVETDNFIIKRTFTEKGGSLTITNSDGMTAKSPQALLDKIVGEIAFDPMKFIHDYDAKKQREVLMELAKLDFSDIDTQIAKVKKERSEVRAAKENFEFEHDRINVPEDVAGEEKSMSDLMEDIQKAVEHNSKQVTVKTQIHNIETNIRMQERDVASQEREIESLTKQLEDAKRKLQASFNQQDELQKQKEALEKNLQEPIDVEEKKAELANIEQFNKQVRAKITKAEYKAKAEVKRKHYSVLGENMKDLESQKAKRLAEAQMPVAGLSVDDNGVVYEGIPLSQVNTAKQLEIAVAVSMALNPKLRVIRMSGNDLDSDSLRAIEKIATDNDYQVWIEKVDETGKIGVVIEDGTIAPSVCS